jgi:hypothetical protein
VADDRDKKSGVFESGEDRAAAELDRRRRAKALAHGVPVHTPVPDDFTPVSDVLPIAHDEAMRVLLARIWQHTANSEMRMLAAVNRTDAGQLRADFDDLEHAHNRIVERITDATGKSGDNGKLGELKRRVDAWTSKMWWGVTVLVGGLGAAAVKLVFVVRAFDAVEARSIASEQHIKLLQAQVMTLQAAALSRPRARHVEPGPTTEPAHEPGKDSP